MSSFSWRSIIKLIEAESDHLDAIILLSTVLWFHCFDWVGNKQQSYFNCCRLVLTEELVTWNYMTASWTNGGQEVFQINIV